ncbi:MAG: carboxymuconolactone decarboxylase family protein [Dehalococcoidia bacterium]|nr:carboxymuconolactone decarboxylase family protein [Dehalococcoidia bacterium]
MSRQLVVCNRTSGSRALSDYAREQAGIDPSIEFTILVPAAPGFGWKAWDDLRLADDARMSLARATASFEQAGARVTRTMIGARDPLAAIEDELREGPPYDAVVISTLPAGVSRWLRLDLVARARKKVPLPVVHVVGDPVPGSEPTGVERELVAAGGVAAEGRTGVGSSPASVGELRWVRPYIGEETVGSLVFPDSPVDASDEGLDVVWRRLHEGRGVAKLFGALAGSPRVLDAYVRFVNSVWAECGLEPELRELAILRVARVQRFEYLWHQHVAIARSLGVPDARIAAVEHYRSSEHVQFDARERAVLGFVDAFCGAGGGVDEARAVVGHYVPDRTLSALGLLAGFYWMTGKYARAFAVETEEAFVGWDLYG